MLFTSGIAMGCRASLPEQDVRGTTHCEDTQIVSQVLEFPEALIQHWERLLSFFSALECATLEIFIYLNQNERSKATLDDTQKLIILYGIAATLSFLHSQEILHSDLKPSNIFLDKDCKIKISDFGISKLFRQKYDENAIFYLSPEIIESNFTSYTKEGDIYAFSIIAYQI